MVPESAPKPCVLMDRWLTILNLCWPTRCCMCGTFPRPRPRLRCRLDGTSWRWPAKELKVPDFIEDGRPTHRSSCENLAELGWAWTGSTPRPHTVCEIPRVVLVTVLYNCRRCPQTPRRTERDEFRFFWKTSGSAGRRQNGWDSAQVTAGERPAFSQGDICHGPA